MGKVESKRIEWIDIAKGICILMMIVGHTVEFGSTIRNIIFSFHMPLFIVLSGYTYNCDRAKINFLSQTIRDIKQLGVPVIVTSALSVILQFVFWQEKTIYSLVEIIRNILIALIWSSGVSVWGYPSLRSLWFLVSLFWIRVIGRIVFRFFSKKNGLYILFALSLAGGLLGNKLPLPQNMDVTFTMLFFFGAGIVWKDNCESVEKFSIPLFVAAMVFWFTCIDNGIYIELASRTYRNGFVCFFEALAGVFVCVKLSECISEIKFAKIPLQIIGRETLLLLCIHYLDKYFKMIWLTENQIISSVYRMIFDLGIWMIIMLIRWLWTYIKSKRKRD